MTRTVVKYHGNKEESGLIFKNGIDPNILIDIIKEIESPKHQMKPYKGL